MDNHIPSAKDIVGPSPLIAIANEPPAKLIVDPPLSEPLSQGRVFIQYRTDVMTEWRMARLAYFPPELPDLSVGIMACSPQREGFEAEFTDFRLGPPVSRDIH